MFYILILNNVLFIMFSRDEKEDTEALRTKGNNYMQDKQYLKAVDAYTKAIEQSPNNLVLLSNRAEAFIKLGYFNTALLDCDEVLKGNPDALLKQKTLYRKARALEQLAENEEDLIKVKEIYDKLETKINTESLEEKFRNIKGQYNIKEIYDYEKECMNTIFGKKYYLDSLNKEIKYTSYCNNESIEMDYSEERGVFWKAKKEIKAGTLLIVEKPIMSTYMAEIKRYRGTFDKFKDMGFSSNEIALTIIATFIKDMMKYPADGEYITKKITQLSTQKTSKYKIEKRQEEYNIKDEDVLKEIISNNAILTIRTDKKKIAPNELSYGLYLKSSFFNHSCLPNCFYFGVANLLFVKAIDNIKEGEELTISYIEPKPLYQRRNEMNKWNFQCNCKLCQYEVEVCDKDAYFNVYEAYVKIQNIMTQNNINTYNEIEDKLNVALQDDIKVIFDSLIMQNVIDYETEQYKFINFIFYKAVGTILGHIDKYKNYANFCFEKAYEAIRKISMRERYDIITHWIILCKGIMFPLKIHELEVIANKDEEVLFNL